MEKDSGGVPDWVTTDSEPESPEETVIFEGTPNTVEATQPEQIFVHASHGGPAGIYVQTNAVLALVLAIVGLVFCGLCTAIPGLILAQTALAQTEAQPGHPDHGVARAAQIVSWITIGIWVLLIGFYVLVFGAVIASSSA
ncbi:MAG: DUF4190 domain-containing protein [Candidatus Thalassarchaeaceae archaeon]|jgi:hypothetical protein|nr:DUF4190 domain-containing protein [Candidatus Thalassarchaeaceae archaeon]